jgi:hypothetical protein
VIERAVDTGRISSTLTPEEQAELDAQKAKAPADPRRRGCWAGRRWALVAAHEDAQAG